MDYLKKFFTCAKTRLPRRKKVILPQEQKLSPCLKPYEHYLYKIQHIIRWEEPTETILSVLLVNALFWFLTYVQWRFYGILFAFLCSFLVHEAWVEHIWPEIRLPKEPKQIDEQNSEICQSAEGILSVSEMSQYASSIKMVLYKQYHNMRYLRATQPPVYCALVSMGCLAIAGIGTFLSGIVLIYLLTMAFLLIPGIIKHFLSSEHKRKLYSAINFISSAVVPADGGGNIEDYMPESTKENMALLVQAGDNNDLSTPSTEDSSLGDLMMPGYDESSVDTVESLMLPTIPQDSSEDTDSEGGALRFKSSHFNGDGSSTDEEVSLVKDLVFPDVSEVAGSTANDDSAVSSIRSGLRQTVAGVLYKTFTGAMNIGVVIDNAPNEDQKIQTGSRDAAVAPRDPCKDNIDSDSEFEIIDSEDADS